MPSAFSHALLAFAAGKTFHRPKTLLLVLGIICAVIPDLDVFMNPLVGYEHPFGHRGFFHSLFFCALLALIFTFLFLASENAKNKRLFFIYLFICGASHGLLDMLTNGGLGVALFAPFDNTRYFFPFRPIKVSPIGIARFFSERGLLVIKSELLWIALPCSIYIFALVTTRKNTRP